MGGYDQKSNEAHRSDGSGRMGKNCHFCVVVNQWCRGASPSGKPDDCINCGRCEGRQE